MTLRCSGCSTWGRARYRVCRASVDSVLSHVPGTAGAYVIRRTVGAREGADEREPQLVTRCDRAFTSATGDDQVMSRSEQARPWLSA